MIQIIIFALAVALYVLYVYILFLASAYALPIGCVAFIGVVLYNYSHTTWTGLFGGGGWTDSPHGREPAYRQYFFRKAYYDYKTIVEDSWPPNRRAAEWVIEQGKKLFTNSAVLFTWPLGVAFYVLAAAGSLAAGVAYLAFGLIHLAIIIACATLVISTAYLLRLIEYGSMLWRRAFLACPNAGCYKKIDLPIYICPKCGIQHRRLLPGSYGVFRRRCKCGAKLQTLFLLGRNHLPSICPHENCGRPLSTSMGPIRNIHIPVVGGPAAGKTSFLMANMSELHNQAKSGKLTLNFSEKKHQLFFQQCYSDFEKGVILAKTAEESPDAFMVTIKSNGGREKLLYMYDAAGELYQQADTLRRHDYYKYIHAVMFLLDPFSISQLRLDFGPSLERAEGDIKPCAERPQDVYDRMIGTLRQFSTLGRRLRSVPIAVVLTKMDAFNLEAVMKPIVNENQQQPPSKQDPESEAVRQWLIGHGEGNLVRSIENDFKKIRYFHCSALGRIPNQGSAPFVPKRVLEPTAWILKDYGLKLQTGKERYTYQETK